MSSQSVAAFFAGTARAERDGWMDRANRETDLVVRHICVQFARECHREFMREMRRMRKAQAVTA
jgi:hypothetical protein